MTYSTDIDALPPDHRWAFDGSVGTDEVTPRKVFDTNTDLSEITPQ